MKKNELILLFITIGVGTLSLIYVYVIEPNIKTLFKPGLGDLRNKKYIDIFNRKNEIQNRASRVFMPGYWKKNVQDQQIAFQIYIENIARETGIVKIKSILPLQVTTNNKNNYEIVLQVDVECSIGNLTKFLYNTSVSDVPIQILKLKINSDMVEPENLRVQIRVSTIWLNIE
jgi:hypothetical protein